MVIFDIIYNNHGVKPLKRSVKRKIKEGWLEC